VLVERILDSQRILAQIRVSKQPHPGDFLLFPDDIRLEVIARREQFYELRYTDSPRSILAVIESIGQIPLPPYMHRTPEEVTKNAIRRFMPDIKALSQRRLRVFISMKNYWTRCAQKMWTWVI